MRHIRSAIVTALFCFVGFLAPTVANADATIDSGDGQMIVVQRGEGRLITLSRPASSIFLANPSVATLTVKSPRLVHLFGNVPGETTLYALDEEDQVILSTKLRVELNLGELRDAIRDLVPDSEVDVQSIAGSIVLDGAVQTAADAENVRRLATRFLGKGAELINRLDVMAPNQVNLRVRIAEVSRTILRELGIHWNAAGTSGDFAFGLVTNGFASSLSSFGTGNQASHMGYGAYYGQNGFFETLLDALEQEGLVSLLAEPNLTAVSGETASFLAGGEFPVPVAQSGDANSNTITVAFKTFGVSLSFTPTLLEQGRISIRVRPEVSSLTNEGAVQLGDFVIPALSTRQADTTVELASGQTFAIAGLIQNNTQHNADKVPGLGDIPILGELFRSDKFQREETELVILVTPYIVRPVSDHRLTDPTDATIGAEGTSRLGKRYHYGLAGPAGFIIE